MKTKKSKTVKSRRMPCYWIRHYRIMSDNRLFLVNEDWRAFANDCELSWWMMMSHKIISPSVESDKWPSLFWMRRDGVEMLKK
jgi:hypothetical protein